MKRVRPASAEASRLELAESTEGGFSVRAATSSSTHVTWKPRKKNRPLPVVSDAKFPGRHQVTETTATRLLAKAPVREALLSQLRRGKVWAQGPRAASSKDRRSLRSDLVLKRASTCAINAALRLEAEFDHDECSNRRRVTKGPLRKRDAILASVCRSQPRERAPRLHCPR